MGASKERIARNQGRVEFLACLETIEKLVEQGFDKKKIYARLQEKNAVRMSYVTFWRHFAKWAQPKKPGPGQAPALLSSTMATVPSGQTPTVPTLPRSGPLIIGKSGRETSIPKDFDGKKLD